MTELASPAPEVSTTLDQRVAAIVSEAHEEAQAAPDTVPDAQAPEAADTKPEPVADEIAKAREERQARLAALRAKEQEAKAKRAREQEHKRTEQEAGEAAKLRERNAQLEAMLQDPMSLVAAAEERGISVPQLAEAIRDSITNPEKLAARQATVKVSEAEKRLLERLASLESKLLSYEEQQQIQASQQAEVQAAQALISHVAESARIAPLSAAYLERYGAGEFVKYATAIAGGLPKGAGLQALHDAIEADLDGLQFYPNSKPQSATPSRTGAAKPKSLSNAALSARATVAEEEDLSALSFEERLARIKGSP